jgi:hypothetical protein
MNCKKTSVSVPEKKQQKQASDPAKEPFLWFNRIGVEISWKHRTIPLIPTPDTRIFSPVAVAALCDTIGRYWYLFKRLRAV